MRTYSELITIPSFEDRFAYLKLNGLIGKETFGFDRYLNQTLYKSKEWKDLRHAIIARDLGCDLAVEGHDIYGPITIHHMNPITDKDILERSELVFNPEFLICVSHITHNAIHYGDISLLEIAPIVRAPNDTCPWK